MDSFPQNSRSRLRCTLQKLLLYISFDLSNPYFVDQVGTAVTNAFIKARRAVDQTSEAEVETVPIVSTSVAYGVYMAVSSNLRY